MKKPLIDNVISHGWIRPVLHKYTDGGLSGVVGNYYLRALSIYSLKDRVAKLAMDLSEGYLAGMFTGGMGSGHEFRSWDGVPNGYEGTLIVCTTQVYVIAIERGVMKLPILNGGQSRPHIVAGLNNSG